MYVCMYVCMYCVVVWLICHLVYGCLPVCAVYEEDGPGMRVLVQLVPSLDSSITEESEVITLGILKLAPETSWVSTDAKIATVFKVHCSVSSSSLTSLHSSFSSLLLI